MQDYRGQIGTYYFRVGKLWAIIKVVFFVESVTDTIANAATAPCPLVGAGLGDGLDWQPLYLGSVTVSGQSGAACIYHIAYAWHG